MEARSTLQWVGARRNFFPLARAARDRTGAIFCSNSAVTVLISLGLAQNWRRSRHGAVRSSSVLLTMRTSRLQTKSKNAASNRAFRTWYGGRSSCFNITSADTFSWLMPVLCGKRPRKTVGEGRSVRKVDWIAQSHVRDGTPDE